MPGQSPPGRRHVDFGAAYEGPVFAAGEDRAVRGGTPISVDELILCEDCIRDAAKLVGLGNVEAAEKVNDELRREYEELSDRAAAQKAHIDQLEAAFASREDLQTAMTPERIEGTGPGGDVVVPGHENLEKASMRELADLGKPFGLTFRPGTSKVEAREQIREARAKAAA